MSVSCAGIETLENETKRHKYGLTNDAELVLYASYEVVWDLTRPAYLIAICGPIGSGKGRTPGPGVGLGTDHELDGPRDGGKMEPFVRHHNPRYVLETKSKIVYGDSDIPSVVLTCPVSAGEVQ